MDIDNEKQEVFQAQYAMFSKTQGVFKFQQLDKEQTKHLMKQSGLGEQPVKSLETSIKIGTIFIFLHVCSCLSPSFAFASPSCMDPFQQQGLHSFSTQLSKSGRMSLQ